MPSRRFRPPPEECPNCGDEVPRNAWACPTCGSDYETGWSEEAAYDNLDLPADPDEFNYDEFVQNEFGGDKQSALPKGLHPVWWVTGVVLLILFFLSLYLFGVAIV